MIEWLYVPNFDKVLDPITEPESRLSDVNCEPSHAQSEECVKDLERRFRAL